MPRTVTFTIFEAPDLGMAIKASPREGILIATVCRFISSATVGKRLPIFELTTPNDEVFYRCTVRIPSGKQQIATETRFYVFGGSVEETDDFINDSARVACPALPIGKGWKICVRDFADIDQAGDRAAFIAVIQE